MTARNSCSNKDNFKLIEVPLDKFHSEALPYHIQLYEKQKDIIEKCMSNKNTEQLSYEMKNKSRIVRQLKDLLYELDTLRTKVYDEDLDKFDSRTFSLRKSISSLIKDYTALEKSATHFLESQNEINENIENENPFNEADRIQINASLDELQLQQTENTYQKVEALNKDIENLHGIYVDLNTMVCSQKEGVNTIESNVEKTEENVNQGLSNLIKAHKSVLVDSIMKIYKKISTYRLKSATYPISGAVLGGLVGGPIGLVAGFKVGGLAALGCGIAGYTGGKLYKNFNDIRPQNSDNTDNEEHDTVPKSHVKKDM